MAERTDPSCIFCRIAAGELGTEFVAETELSVAFRDLAPQAPTHVLVVPRHHVAALRNVSERDGELMADLLLLARRVAEQEGLFSSGYRVITNDGADAGQTVHHLHFHVLGGKELALPLG